MKKHSDNLNNVQIEYTPKNLKIHKESVHEKLFSLSDSNLYPMHMPGHKRNVEKFGDNLLFSIDTTEITGFDNLNNPCGFLKEKEDELKDIYGASSSFYLVNGSTSGILAGIRTVTRPHDKVIVARNCHASVYNALELFNLDPIFILPETYDAFGIYGSITPSKIENLLIKNRYVKAVILTSPTFEGILSDIEKIAEICHKHGTKLIVDQAHGAHFIISSSLFTDAIKLGADIVIESYHKTLPSLTSTAIVNISDKVDKKRMQRNLSIFQTSSPSYILMASINNCAEYINSDESKENFRTLLNYISDLKFKCKDLKHLRILDFDANVDKNRDSRLDFDNSTEKNNNSYKIYKYDPTKIIISTKTTNISGPELLSILHNNYDIELEMAYGNYALAITTVGDTEYGFIKLADALIKIDSTLSASESVNSTTLSSIPKRYCQIYEAVNSENEKIMFENSTDYTSAEYVWVYPPGVPLLIPGEVIDDELIMLLKKLESQKNDISCTYGNMPKYIQILKKR